MKKIFFLVIIVTISFSANACEICGCGIGNYFIGFLPQFNKHFIGLRYQYKKFHTILKDDPSEFSRDQYTTLELWGGFKIGKRWQLIALLPYHFVHQVSDEGIADNNGIGDIAVTGNYKLLDKTRRSINHQLWVGAGIKLPTGKFRIEETDEDIVSKSNIQAGSGSVDVMLNAAYNIRAGRFSINTAAGYKINTGNKNDYRFGDRFSANSLASYKIGKRAAAFLPNAGLLYEYTAANVYQKEKIAATGGYFLAAVAGAEFNVKKITIGANVQLPVAQDLSDRQTVTRVRTMAHVTYAF